MACRARILLLVPLAAHAYLPLPYVKPVFRPPAEAGSLILQVTIGCSWNQCSFCEMYQQPQQKFRAKPLEDIENDLALAAEMSAEFSAPVKRVFLADGDAMGLPTKRLAAILKAIRTIIPSVSRVSSYCLPRNVRSKDVSDLKMLQQLGLRTMYVGCESGDDTVLRCVRKGEDQESSVDALHKLHDAGLKTSVMILHGLGGRVLSEMHVRGSAELITRAPPTYLSTLVVSFPLGQERHREGFDAEGVAFEMLSTGEVVDEQRSLLEQLDGLEGGSGKGVIFRSDHASNYLPLKGTLPRDRKRLISELGAAQRGEVGLRPEWMRGL